MLFTHIFSVCSRSYYSPGILYCCSRGEGKETKLNCYNVSLTNISSKIVLNVLTGLNPYRCCADSYQLYFRIIIICALPIAFSRSFSHSLFSPPPNSPLPVSLCGTQCWEHLFCVCPLQCYTLVCC